MLIGCPMLISARRFKNTAGFFFIGLDLIGFNRWRICIVRIQRRRRDWIQPETKESGRFGKKSKFQNRLHVSSVAPIAFVFNQIISLLKKKLYVNYFKNSVDSLHAKINEQS